MDFTTQIEALRQSVLADVNAHFKKFIETLNTSELVERFDLEPTLPDMTDIKPFEETEADPMPHNVPGFDWSEDEAWTLVPIEDERWSKVVEWVILKGATREQLNSFQEQKQVRFGKQNRDILENLIWFREELLKGKDGAFDLKGILGQNQTDDLQKGLWLKLAKERILK